MSALATGVDSRSLGALFESAAARLREAGIEGARRDARLLLAEALGLEPQDLLLRPERMIGEEPARRAETMIERRAAGEPVSRILGRREFWSLAFRIGPAVLDPRPDSETLVRAVLERIPDRAAPLEILDLGTGSGCLLLALLHELPRARGLGTDISAAALETARDNATRLGLADRVRFEARDWAAGLTGSWQVIVSNPPYIREADLAGLAPEVARYEPGIALAGGRDGLEAYRRLLPQAADRLAPGGLLAVEIGAGQAVAVEELIRGAGLRPLGRVRDLGGFERCLLACGKIAQPPGRK